MQKREFNIWIEKHYAQLRRIALKIDFDTGEDLLHDTIVSILGARQYQAITNLRGTKTNAMAWITQALKTKRLERRRKAFSQARLDAYVVPEQEEVYELAVDSALTLEKLWPQLSDLSRWFLSHVVLGGYTAKEAYNFCGDTRDYSTVLKAIKADIERVRKLA